MQTQEGWLVQQEKLELEALNNFFFIVWTANPNKDNVRIILNDGTIKLWMRRDKFMKVMKDLLGPTTHELEYSLYRIEESLHTYGNFYFYDRVNNEFKEVGFLPDFEHINPLDLIKEAHASVVKQTLTDHYKEITKENQQLQNTLIDASIPVNKLDKFFKVFRNFEKKRKSKI
jgi:hypothetical protein